MSTRPELVAHHRAITGKAVAQLRRNGQLPAVVYGHGHASEALVVDAREFDQLRRHTGRNALVDLKVDDERAQPVMVYGVQEHPVTRRPLHVDFFLVKMTEEMTVDVPVVMNGESYAVSKLGGTLLHLLDTVKVRALPADVPSALELDVTPLETFEAMLHVSDLQVPERITIVTDADEPLARVQPPRVEEVPVAAEEVVEVVPEGEAAAEAAAGETEGAPAE
ncbi:MAG TPA: 50S ribosomal protein L25 [Candidatus Dormibacteraeota bacterium]|nr:50S ribosomal protein L25 [Candidatus Dormibacteraeota bacterium]